MSIGIRQIFAIIFLMLYLSVSAEDGYRLWFRYDRIADESLLSKYNKNVAGWIIEGDSPVLNSYFQTFSKRSIPELVEKPEKTLDYYRNYKYTDIPGISGR